MGGFNNLNSNTVVLKPMDTNTTSYEVVSAIIANINNTIPLLISTQNKIITKLNSILGTDQLDTTTDSVIINKLLLDVDKLNKLSSDTSTNQSDDSVVASTVLSLSNIVSGRVTIDLSNFNFESLDSYQCVPTLIHKDGVDTLQVYFSKTSNVGGVLFIRDLKYIQDDNVKLSFFESTTDLDTVDVLLTIVKVDETTTTI